MKRVALLILLFCLSVPLLLNAFGWNLYLYINIGAEDYVLGCAKGTAHFALTPHIDLPQPEVDLSAFEAYGLQTKTLFQAGPLDCFLESRTEPMQLFTFQLIKPHGSDEYRGFEFPWLILPLLIFVLFLFSFFGKKKPAEA